MCTHCENRKLKRIIHMIIFIKEETKMKRKKERAGERGDKHLFLPKPSASPLLILADRAPVPFVD